MAIDLGFSDLATVVVEDETQAYADVNGAGNILIRVVPNPETKLIQGNVVS